MFYFKSIHIQNFKSISDEYIDFWVNKSVFVGKNGSGKSNILKAIEKVFHFENPQLKKTDFLNINNKIIISANLEYQTKTYAIILQAKYNKINQKITITRNHIPDEIKNHIKVIYIRSDRKIEKNNMYNWFHQLINLILENKEYYQTNKENIDFQNIKKLWESQSDEKTWLFITLLKLYLYSIKNTSNNGFRIFIIDQPENFLHPHATKLIDRLLQEIWEERNTQIFYSTHSTELVSNFKKDTYTLNDIIFVKKERSISHTRKIQNKYGRYEKIMINLIFKNASIFFSDAVILTEWETERISIPNIYENYDWSKHPLPEYFNQYTSWEIKNFFNLDMNNINIIDVGGKWSLSEWYAFATEIFWEKNVYALIDKDKDFESDRINISNSIFKVHQKRVETIDEFKKYNWIVLNWEFEHYYKVSIIQNFLENIIEKRGKQYWDDFDPEKHKESLQKLNYRIEKLKETKKISKWYEILFNKYFRHYGKPTIAFHLSTWLSLNNWYHNALLDILRDIILEINHNK